MESWEEMRSVKFDDLKVSIAKIHLDQDDIVIFGIPDNGRHDVNDIWAFVDGLRDWFHDSGISNKFLVVTAVSGVAVFDEDDMAANGWIRKP